MRPSTDLTLDGLTIVTRVRRAREHRVLTCDPPEAGVLTPTRNPRSEGCRAQHSGAAEFDEARALGLVYPAALEGDGTELVGRTAIATSHGPTLALSWNELD